MKHRKVSIRQQAKEPGDRARAGTPGDRIRWVRCAVLAVTCVLVIGVYGWSARPGWLEWPGSPAADNYYNLLVRGFRDGQLNVKAETPAGLRQLTDPYDPAANAPVLFAGRNPIFDMSYYQGKLYLYFGVTPALMLFWPCVAVTGHYLSHQDAALIFCVVGFLASAGLLRAVWRRYFAEVGMGVMAAGVLALGLVTGLPVMMSHCDVYEVAVSCGYALTMVALGILWFALQDSRWRVWWLAVASLAYGLAVGARPSLLYGAVILLVPVVQAGYERRRIWPALCAATVPILFIGLGLMLYNYGRFNNPLEFGWHYQLNPTRQDTKHYFSLSYLWFNFRVYFLGPARWTRHFPFVHDIGIPPLPAGHTMPDHAFAVLSNTPLVWLALAAPLAWRGRTTEAGSGLRWLMGAVMLLFSACALTLGLHDGTLVRYEVEFLPTLVLMAVIGIFGLERALFGKPLWRGVVRCGWSLLLIVSMAYNLFASIEGRAETDADVGWVLLQQGKVDAALLRLQQAVELEPDSFAAHSNLGSALFLSGRMDEAIAHFRTAVEIDRNSAEAQNILGTALFQKGRVEEAITHLQSAVQIHPELAAAQCSLGAALFQKGRVDEAIAHSRMAVQFHPDFAPAWKNLDSIAWTLATSPDASVRNAARAVELALQVNRHFDGKNPEIIETLAAAYAEAGQFDESVRLARQALLMAAAQTNAALAQALHKQIESYQAGVPCRDTSPASDIKASP